MTTLSKLDEAIINLRDAYISVERNSLAAIAICEAVVCVTAARIAVKAATADSQGRAIATQPNREG